MTKIISDNTKMKGNCPNCGKELSFLDKFAEKYSSQHCNVCGKVSLGSNFIYH